MSAREVITRCLVAQDHDEIMESPDARAERICLALNRAGFGFWRKLDETEEVDW